PPLGLRSDAARPAPSLSGADPPPGAVRPGLLRESLRRGALRLPAAGRRGPDPRQLQPGLPAGDGALGLVGVAAGARRHGGSGGLSRRGSRLCVRALALLSAPAHQHAVGSISVSPVPLSA